MVSTPKLLALLLATGVSQQAAAGNFFCCQDGQGSRRICGDSLPEQCRGRPYRILDSNGNLLKEVAAPLTPEQKARQAEEERLKKAQEEAAREQKRKDSALLATYASLGDIDQAQKKSETETAQSIQGIQQRIEDARKKRKKASDETEFYKNKPIPNEVNQRIKGLDQELQLQQELLDAKQKEFAALKGKFDSERKRYRELTER